ncbi:lytic transglycosylase domain-containing protein [Marivibrio halodurans]|uniref:Lytic transglycosylase domain-containing protein n=1 Tax=Marivibrio halodurans TaxID=2039722 RepID=A0A8J7SAC6_9PROT|nr:lytic transglycosylase domain-containing protein [Marivibrio halodurans]
MPSIRSGFVAARSRRVLAVRGARVALRLGAVAAIGLFLATATEPRPAVADDLSNRFEIDPPQTESAALLPGRFTNGERAEGTASGHAKLPDILGDEDRTRYARIFDLQNAGRMQEADRLIATLDDDLLMGHVLFQRYMHPTAWRSTYLELKGWMAEYADHPGAQRIYRLALKRRPPNYKWPEKPRSVSLPGIERIGIPEMPEGQAARRLTGPDPLAGKSGWERGQIRKAQYQIRRWVQRGSVTHSLDYLDQPKYRDLFTPAAFAESLGVVARGYFRYHKDAEAIAVAERAESLSPDGAALAQWWGGLAAWRAGKYETAFDLFSGLAHSPSAARWDRAAGGYWAARAALVGGMPEQVNPMLSHAAEVPRSFYGLLATRSLGKQPALDFSLPALGKDEVELLTRIPAARRAIALIEVGQTERADGELRRFTDALPPAMANTLLAFADAAGLADLAYRVGRDMAEADGAWLDAALYPLPGWRPMDGFSVDRALIYAFVRQESRFRARAKSYAGARGLMQLMPATAGWVAGERYRGVKRAALYEPSLNLSLGQRYIRMLMGDPSIEGNLFYAAAAYNAGPGNLNKWRERIDYDGDPLLFIESLPSRETRDYVEHVMANLWVYRHRLGQASPTLDALIGGAWPIYMTLDDAEVAEQAIAVE